MSALAVLLLDPVGGSAAQRQAEQELRKAEYHRDDPTLLSRALTWLGDRLDWLFHGPAGGHAALLALVVLLVAITLAIAKAGVPRRTPRRTAVAGDDPLRPDTARDHRRLATEFAAAGRRDEAMREWLRAAIQTIEDRGVLAPEPGRTGAATAREAGPLLPSAAADLRAATEAFDEVWFGGRPADDGDVAVAQAAADGVRAARIERLAPDRVRVRAAMVTTAAAPGVTAGAVVRPAWRRLRFWLALGVLLALAGVAVALLSPRPGRALDPRSASKDGSKALAVLLARHGTAVTRSTSLADAERAGAATVLVVAPDSYSAAQLARLSRDAGRLVLARPSVAALRAVAPAVVAVDTAGGGPTAPACAEPGALAAGSVDLPEAQTYRTTEGSACFGGAVVVAPRLVVLGSAAVLRNDALAHDGVAALDLNSISGNGSARRVVWLLPGARGGRSGRAECLAALPGRGAPRVRLAGRRRAAAGAVAGPAARAGRYRAAAGGGARGRGGRGPRPALPAGRRPRPRRRRPARRGRGPARRPSRTAPQSGRAGRGRGRGGRRTSRCFRRAVAGRPAPGRRRRPAAAGHRSRRTGTGGRRAAPSEGNPPVSEPKDPAREGLHRLRTEVAKAVVGQDPAVTGVLIGLLCRGHVLVEGVPGVAKTLLVRALAAALELRTTRIQFTADLMPGDVTGSLIYDPSTGRFEFREGPVFTNLLLADEINRTPPKTQSALLEAMEERQVSVDGTPAAAAGPVLRHRHPEPGRVRGHVSAARGPAGPVPGQGDDAAARPRDRTAHPGRARRRLRPARPGRGPGCAR